MDALDFEEIHRKIGQNVAKYRKEAGLSQLDLSLKLGHKSVSIVASAERCYNGKHFNINHLFQIAAVLDVEVCKLINIEEVA
jgi:ribosome-binding protein aMBF1 (putative translation factor)